MLDIGVLGGEATHLNGLDHMLEHVQAGLVGDIVLSNLLHVLTLQVLLHYPACLRRGPSEEALTRKVQL